MRVALFQYNIIWEDKEVNKTRILAIIGDYSKNFDWLVFPEMTLTGFSMETGRTQLDREDIEFFQEIAATYNCIVTFGGNVDDNNCSLTLDFEGNIINEYKKNHLFSYVKEDENYKSGVDCENFRLNAFSVLPAICYDLRFTYHFWNAARDTDIFCVIANWPEKRKLHWRTLLRARAIENQAYVVAVNRVGADPDNNYSGNSMVIDPLGNIVCEVENTEGIFVVEINSAKGDEVRSNFQFLKDRKQ